MPKIWAPRSCSVTDSRRERGGVRTLGHRHEDPRQDVGEEPGAGEQQHHRRDPDDHRVDVEVLGHAGAHARDVTLIGAAPQLARPGPPNEGGGGGGGPLAGSAVGEVFMGSASGGTVRTTIGDAPERTAAAPGVPRWLSRCPCPRGRGIISGSWPPSIVPTSSACCSLPERLVRSSDDRVVAGVCGGLGAGLGVDPTVHPPGVGGAHAGQRCGRVRVPRRAWPPCRASPRSRPHQPLPASRLPRAAVGVGLITLGALLLFGHLGLLLPAGIVWAAALSAVGFALVWARTAEADRTRGLLLRSAGGGLLLVVGLGLLFAAGGVLSRIGQLGLAVLATGVGVAVLLGPVDRAALARPRHRAPRAHPLRGAVRDRRAPARLRAPDACPHPAGRCAQVGPRRWLGARSASCAPGSSTSARPKAKARPSTSAERWIGWSPRSRTATTSRSISCSSATARWSRGWTRSWAPSGRLRTTRPATPGVAEVSVYVEVEPERVEAYVRDRGKGFDLDAVEPGRLGVRQSIVGRMARHGGKAEVHTAPGEGTEVALEVGRVPEREGRAHELRRGCSSSTTTRCSARACGPSWATASRWWGRRPTSSRPSRASAPPSRRWCCSTCTCLVVAARR